MRTPAIIAAIVLGITSPSLEELEPVRVREEALAEAPILLPIEIPQEETPVIMPAIEFHEPVLDMEFGAEEYLEDEPIGTIEAVEMPKEHLWSDSVTITHYCVCSVCCGKWAGGGTASGTIPTAGRTVACGDLPFGTKIRIEGLDGIYIVEDRGVTGYWLDIFCDSHQEALQRGMYSASVWIVEED